MKYCTIKWSICAQFCCLRHLQYLMMTCHLTSIQIACYQKSITAVQILQTEKYSSVLSCIIGMFLECDALSMQHHSFNEMKQVMWIWQVLSQNKLPGCCLRRHHLVGFRDTEGTWCTVYIYVRFMMWDVHCETAAQFVVCVEAQLHKTHL